MSKATVKQTGVRRDVPAKDDQRCPEGKHLEHRWTPNLKQCPKCASARFGPYNPHLGPCPRLHFNTPTLCWSCGFDMPAGHVIRQFGGAKP